MPALSRRHPTSDLRKSAISMESTSSSGYYPIIDSYGSTEDLDLDYPISQVLSITNNSDKSRSNLRLATSTQDLHELYHSSEEEASPSPDDYTDSSSTSSSPSSARNSLRSLSQADHDSDSESDYADFYGDEEPTFHDAGKVEVSPCGPRASFMARIIDINRQAPMAKRTTNAAYRPFLNPSANGSASSVAICTATAVPTSDIDFARKRLSLYGERVTQWSPTRTINSPPLIPTRKDSLKSNTSVTKRKPLPASSSLNQTQVNIPEPQLARRTIIDDAATEDEAEEPEVADDFEPELLMRESDEIQNRAILHHLLKSPTPTSYTQYDPFALSPPRLAPRKATPPATAISTHNAIQSLKKVASAKRESTASSIRSTSSTQLTLTKSGKWGADKRVEGMIWPKSMDEEKPNKWKGLSRRIVSGGVKRRS